MKVGGVMKISLKRWEISARGARGWRGASASASPY